MEIIHFVLQTTSVFKEMLLRLAGASCHNSEHGLWRQSIVSVIYIKKLSPMIFEMKDLEVSGKIKLALIMFKLHVRFIIDYFRSNL